MSLTSYCLFPWRLGGAGRFSQDHPNNINMSRKKFCISFMSFAKEVLQMWGLMIKRHWGGLERQPNASTWCVCVCVSVAQRQTHKHVFYIWTEPLRALNAADSVLVEQQRRTNGRTTEDRFPGLRRRAQLTVHAARVRDPRYRKPLKEPSSKGTHSGSWFLTKGQSPSTGMAPYSCCIKASWLAPYFNFILVHWQSNIRTRIVLLLISEKDSLHLWPVWGVLRLE